MLELYRDPSQPVEARVDDLLGRMTLAEKVGQLNQRLPGWRMWHRGLGEFALATELDEEIARWGGLGALYGLLRADAWSGRDWSDGVTPAESADLAAMVQERVVAGSRLGIPVLFVEEAAHGHQALGSQLLPANVGVAASWRPDLAEEAAAHTGRELRARGAHLALASGLDMLRDPRWGRSEECFGEDPLLAAAMVRAQVRGLRAEGVGVVLKHFAGQGAAIGGRNGSPAPIGRRELAEIHLPAARAGIAEGAVGVMAAYNDVDGVPCCADEALLSRLLRDEWGFTGIVMADMFAIDRLLRAAASEAAAAAVALRAGVDMSMCDIAYTVVERAVADGLVPESLVDRACRHVLTVKVGLGLLDPPRPLPGFPVLDPHRELVTAGPVLLTNRGGLLPLAAPGRVAVIGPNANDVEALLGDYVPPLRAGEGVSILAGLRDALPGTTVTHEPGSGLREPVPGGVERAVRDAAAADVAVLVLGSTSARRYDDDFAPNGAGSLGGGRSHATAGEGFDVADIELPAAQRALVEAVATTGTPVVAVVVSGRPLGLTPVAAAADALVVGWYPGPEGGRAIADLLTGAAEPTGRLPVSLPRSSGELPVAYDERVEHSTMYVDGGSGPLFAFGAGLGYTSWELAEPTVVGQVSVVAPDALTGLALTATLRNGGPRDGRQVVQLYGRALVPGILPRRAVLLGFTSVAVPADASTDVEIALMAEAQACLGLTGTDRGELLLWLSITGAGAPARPARVCLGGVGALSDGQDAALVGAP